MALRSLVRKMPALGLRSAPMGPLMEPVRVLSPASGSRLMSSHGSPGGQTIHYEGTLAEQLTSGKPGFSPGSYRPSVPVAQPGLTNRDWSPIFSPGCYTNRD
jgi:hypothetical protein